MYTSLSKTRRCIIPRKSPYTIELDKQERKQLESMARKYTSPYYVVVRAKAILLAADGLENKLIGQQLQMPRQIISKWRKRFFEQRLAGLQDLPRRGRPSRFSPHSDHGG